MSNEKLLKISEFADAVGISKQTVYNHIQKNKNNLTQYIQNLNGVVYIEESAILLYKSAKSAEVNQNNSLNESKIESNLNQTESKLESNLTAFESKFESVLMAQIAEKDKYIEELKKELMDLRQQCEEKDKYIIENNKKILEILEKSQKLQENNQVLIARQQEVKQIKDGKTNIFTKLLSSWHKKQ